MAKKVSLVLWGGGAGGIAHIGIIEELGKMKNFIPDADIAINISKDSCDTYEFFKADELVEPGSRSAVNVVKESCEKA